MKTRVALTFASIMIALFTFVNFTAHADDKKCCKEKKECCVKEKACCKSEASDQSDKGDKSKKDGLKVKEAKKCCKKDEKTGDKAKGEAEANKKAVENILNFTSSLK